MRQKVRKPDAVGPRAQVRRGKRAQDSAEKHEPARQIAEELLHARPGADERKKLGQDGEDIDQFCAQESAQDGKDIDIHGVVALEREARRAQQDEQKPQQKAEDAQKPVHGQGAAEDADEWKHGGSLKKQCNGGRPVTLRVDAGRAQKCMKEARPKVPMQATQAMKMSAPPMSAMSERTKPAVRMGPL